MPSVGLFDGDIIAFSCAFVGNKSPNKGASLAAIKEMLVNCIENLSLSSGRIFLTGKDNFRKKIDPEYKLHRKKLDKPLYLTECYDYLESVWGAEWVSGMEADDALGLNQREDTVIITIDKDLDQVPGWHYNWKKFKLYNIDKNTADLFIWQQMLTGDVSDNIKGIKGYGPVKARKLIDSCSNINYVKLAVYDMYCELGREKDFYNNYKLLKILQSLPIEDNWKGLPNE